MATTVVTGAAGALGSVLVRVLGERGHKVAALGSAGSAARLGGGGVLGIGLDFASTPAWDDALRRIEAELGPPDGAVLVAGGWQGGAPLHTSDDATWKAMMDANLETAHRTLRALLPGMVARKRGSIVIIGSRAAVQPWTSTGAAAYAASKAAVVALGQAVAAEVLGSGVRINSVLPSTIDTPANRKAMPKADASAWVTPESLSAVIAFLLSDDARDVSGAAVPVYGRA